MTNKIEFEESSGNIFADFGLKDADELHARGLIGCHVVQLLNKRKLKQRELSDILNIKQAEISHLLNGHFGRFTTDKLMEFVRRLDYKITIKISPHKKGEPYHQVATVV